MNNVEKDIDEDNKLDGQNSDLVKRIAALVLNVEKDHLFESKPRGVAEEIIAIFKKEVS